jgi:hypothetical protein
VGIDGRAELARLAHAVALCADESGRTLGDLDRLDGKDETIIIRLDKAGGLTEALALAAEAKRRGLRIMVAGAIGTSLGIAPALLVAQGAEIVDLDGPLHLVSNRVPGCGMRAARSIRPIRISGADPVDFFGHRLVNWSASPSQVNSAPKAVVQARGALCPKRSLMDVVANGWVG